MFSTGKLKITSKTNNSRKEHIWQFLFFLQKGKPINWRKSVDLLQKELNFSSNYS